MNIQYFNYKLIYFKRKIWRFFGFCHRCNTRMNYTTTGRPICPECGY